jgi:long-chain acyl-CoA synthetase
LLDADWTIEKGELTPKLSLKRKIILQHNQEAYQRLYDAKSL